MPDDATRSQSGSRAAKVHTWEECRTCDGEGWIGPDPCPGCGGFYGSYEEWEAAQEASDD